MRNGHADLIVIGGGVLGAFHAYFAARRGLRVLLLDRDRWPSGASARNFGVISSSLVEPDGDWPAYAAASRAIYRELQAEGDLSIQTTGSLYLASTRAEGAVLREFSAVGCQGSLCYLLDAGELCAAYPWVRPEACIGGLLFPDDLSLDSGVFLRQALQRWIVQGLLRYRPLTTVVSVTTGGLHATVHSADGAIFHGERVLVCGGAEYRTLFPSHLRASGLRLSKLQMLRAKPATPWVLSQAAFGGLALRHPAFRACPSYGLLETELAPPLVGGCEISLRVRQDAAGNLIVGASHAQYGLDEIGTHEERMSYAVTTAILDEARRVIDLPKLVLDEVWNGYYLSSPDQPIFTLAVDGRTQIVTGVGGRGMSLAPGFAQANIAAMLG